LFLVSTFQYSTAENPDRKYTNWELQQTYIYICQLTLILVTWRAPNNASRWQMEFNSALKELSFYFLPKIKPKNSFLGQQFISWEWDAN
jgi:hypothetical protein